MGTFSNFGATLLDVQQGMELAKQTQRRDEEWARSQKRADMQDEMAQYGLEDVKRKRADEAGNREAFKTGGLDAVEAEARKRGDQGAAQKAAADRIAELSSSINQRELEAKKLRQPKEIEAANTALDGAITRAPKQNAIMNAELDAKLRDLTEKQVVDMMQLAKYDKKAALKAYNESGLVEAGKLATDVAFDNKKQVWTLTYKDGSTFDMPADQLTALSQKHYPPQYKTLNSGESLVATNPKTGAPTIALTAPAKDVPGKFIETPSGAILDTHTGMTKPGTGGTSPAINAKRDARVKVAQSMVQEALGGSLNMGLPSEDAQKAYPLIMERVGKKIDAGTPPEQAARESMDEIQREGKINTLAPGAAKAPVSWQDFASQPFPTPREARPAARPPAANLSGSVMGSYGLDTPEVPAIFP